MENKEFATNVDVIILNGIKNIIQEQKNLFDCLVANKISIGTSFKKDDKIITLDDSINKTIDVVENILKEYKFLKSKIK